MVKHFGKSIQVIIKKIKNTFSPTISVNIPDFFPKTNNII